jgi:hypothetical protein
MAPTAGPSPWDIGRPQPVFVRLAHARALSGVLLDLGCGTGKQTIFAAGYSDARSASTSSDASSRSPATRRLSGVDTSFHVLAGLRRVTLGETLDTRPADAP